MSSLSRALTDGCAALAKSSESPRTDALLLLERALGRPRAWIAAYGDSNLSPRDAAAFRALCERRKRGTPAAYLLETAGFFGYELFVDERVLIPRPETEHLLDEAIAFIGSRAGAAVLDVGTGSGAIACAIAARTAADVCATDISRAALEVAAENARRLDVAARCRFHHGNLTEPVRDYRFDVVIANLPYIPSSDVPQPPDPVSFEPRLALDGGPDGLTLYRELLPTMQAILKPNALVLLEAAPPTIAKLEELVSISLPDFTIEVRKDYAGLSRYIRAERSAL
jgi:release factor glutamine methyltransferase